MKTIKIKRVYEAAEKTDGYRILVDRLWPRGLKKEDVPYDEWNKDITPSTALRKWFGHKAENFARFAELYRAELKGKTSELQRIKAIANTQPITLLYAAKDKNINHAKILLEAIQRVHAK